MEILNVTVVFKEGYCELTKELNEYIILGTEEIRKKYLRSYIVYFGDRESVIYKG